jgi:hypothetical protein
MEKICTSCSVSKSFDNFYKEKLGLYGLKSICKECHKAKRNKDKEKEYNKNWYDKNKEEILEKKKEYRQENKEKLSQYNLEYKSRPEVIQARKKYDREYIKQRRQEPLFKLKCNIRTYTSRAFRRMGYYKNTKTSKLLGADYYFVKKYIEAQFKKGMTWDNYGEWHIDHIKPLSSAKDEKELISLSHYTNLQPLWAIENQRKHNKIKSKQLRII